MVPNPHGSRIKAFGLGLSVKRFGFGGVQASHLRDLEVGRKNEDLLFKTGALSSDSNRIPDFKSSMMYKRLLLLLLLLEICQVLSFMLHTALSATQSFRLGEVLGHRLSEGSWTQWRRAAPGMQEFCQFAVRQLVARTVQILPPPWSFDLRCLQRHAGSVSAQARCLYVDSAGGKLRTMFHPHGIICTTFSSKQAATADSSWTRRKFVNLFEEKPEKLRSFVLV